MDEFQRAIKHNFGCDSELEEVVPVLEKFRGEIVWQGPVSVYRLQGHETADTCYAWRVGDSEEIVTVLKAPPVSSPVGAVRAAILAERTS